MTLRQLYYFKNIAELQHFTKAAQISLISQPGLSNAMQELEAELNVAFFAKRGRNVELTKCGQLFLPYVRDTLEVLEQGVAKLAGCVNPETGSISMAGLPFLDWFASDIIVRYVAQAKRDNVQFRFRQEATCARLREQLLSGQADLVFSGEIDDPRMDSAYIGEHPLVLLVSERHRLAQCEKVLLRELDGEDFIAFSPNSQLREFTDRVFQSLSIQPNIKAETSQDLIMDGLVAANYGVAMMPYPLGNLPCHTKILPIADGLPPRRLYLMWNREQRLSSAARCFCDFIAQSGEVFSQFLQKRQGH